MSTIRAHSSLADLMRLVETDNVFACPAFRLRLEVHVRFRLVATIWTAPVAKFVYRWNKATKIATSVVASTLVLANSADLMPFAWPTLTGRLVSVVTDSRAMQMTWLSVANLKRLLTNAVEMMTVQVKPFAVKTLTEFVNASIRAGLLLAHRASLVSSRPANLIANA